ncbi:hypothetical protein [Streptomyces litmocidini]|uniref:Uncharacterized protein n=1 Tax=Streptomyces litmocidini TaxID=67318 RepID=A0ABW7UGY5_9ACTN
MTTTTHGFAVPQGAAGEVGGELPGRRAVPTGVELLQELEALDRLAGLSGGEQSEAELVGAGAGHGLGVRAHAVSTALARAGARDGRCGPSPTGRSGHFRSA